MYAREQDGEAKAGKRAQSGPARRSADGAGPAASRILGLQSSAGNLAVSRMLAAGSAGPSTPVQRAPRDPYDDGTYGARMRERARLLREYNASVSGRTHESEHTVGFDSASHNSGHPRGSNREIRRHEGEMPAYYETHRAHRDHIGTGTSSTADATGMNSRQYRDAQYTALEDNNPSAAIFQNQMGFAHQPSFHAATGTVAGDQADDSFRHMIGARGHVPYYDTSGERQRTRRLYRDEQADLHSAREQMRTRQYPTAAEQDEIMRQYGARSRTLRSNNRESELVELRRFPDVDSDRSRSPEEEPRGRDRERSPMRERRSRSRSRADAPVFSQPEEDFSTYGGRDRSRSRSVLRNPSRTRARSRSTTRASSSVLDDSSLYEYIGADDGIGSTVTGDSRRSRSRSRSVSRTRPRELSRSRSRSRSVGAGRRRARDLSPDDSTSYNTMLNSQVNPFGGPSVGGYSARSAGITGVRPRRRGGRSRSRSVAGRHRSRSRTPVVYYDDSDY